MSDLPVPTAGGSYLRDDATGELQRVAGPEDVLMDPAPAPLAEEAPGMPPETPAQEV